jgi:hypothetical protein
MLLRCVDATKAQKLMKEFHEGICGGHFAPTTTAHRIMRAMDIIGLLSLKIHI